GPPLLDPGADAHRGRRPRRVRPLALPRDARQDRGLEARRLPAERTHDLRGPTQHVRQGRRRLPRGEALARSHRLRNRRRGGRGEPLPSHKPGGDIVGGPPAPATPPPPPQLSPPTLSPP